MADSDATVRTKALLALSAMVRQFPPGLEVFRAQGGVSKVGGVAALSEERREQRCVRFVERAVEAIIAEEIFRGHD